MDHLGYYTTPAGQCLTLRVATRSDAQLLVEMFHRLSPETRRLRFQLYTAILPEEHIWREAISLCQVDMCRGVTIVATGMEADGQEQAVAVARFIRATSEDKEAEVSIVVRDDFQRKGLGKHMLLTLADTARAIGVTHFTAWVMTDNIRLMKLIKNMELKDVESETRYGQCKIRVPL